MEYISDAWGLVTNGDTKTENGQLFLAEYILLIDSSDSPLSNKLSLMQLPHLAMINQLASSEVKSGLYCRNVDLRYKRPTSHDNISGIMSYSKVMGTKHRFQIWKYLLWHLGTYDSSSGKSPEFARFLPFNPANFFIWGKCAKSWLYMLFLPFYLINLIISCNQEANDTSGKILSWVELYPHKEHWLCKYLFNYYEKKMKKLYGSEYLKELMKIYFAGNDSDFPIFKELGV